MSGSKFPFHLAYDAAQLFAANLSILCDEIVIAGSIRRVLSAVKDPRRIPADKTIGDIEIVARLASGANLPRRLRELNVPLWVEDDGKTTDGRIHKKLAVCAPNSDQPVKCDLYCATESNWGYILAIRTGPHDPDPFPWNVQMVTKRAKGGLLPNDIILHEGYVYRDLGGMMDPLDIPTENEWFSVLGIPFVPPHRRNATLGRSLSAAVMQEVN